jgi:hypothetical protein
MLVLKKKIKKNKKENKKKRIKKNNKHLQHPIIQSNMSQIQVLFTHPRCIPQTTLTTNNTNYLFLFLSPFFPLPLSQIISMFHHST